MDVQNLELEESLKNTFLCSYILYTESEDDGGNMSTSSFPPQGQHTRDNSAILATCVKIQ